MGIGSYLFAVLSAAGGSGFNHGFHYGCLNMLIMQVRNWYMDIYYKRYDSLPVASLALVPFILAVFAMGALMGSLLIHTFATHIGRKNSLICSSGIVLIGLIFQSFGCYVDTPEVFIVGRFVIGFAVGLSSGICPMYLVEIAPYCIRGATGSFYYVMVALSMFFVFILGYPTLFGTGAKWAYIYVIPVFPPIIQIICLLVCPESPKYLYLTREDEDAAGEALDWFKTNTFETDEDLERLEEEAAVIKETQPITLVSLIEKQTVRSPFIIATVMLAGHSLCGIDSALCFSMYILDDSGYDTNVALSCTIGLGLANFFFTIVAAALVDIIGRKLLLLFSFAGMMVSTAFLVMLIFLEVLDKTKFPNAKFILIPFIFFYVATFALGAGAVPWFYAAELCNHHARSYVMTVATAMCWFFHFWIMFLFLIMHMYWRNFAFILFIFTNLGIMLFGVFTLRETKNLDAIELAELFYEE